VRRFRLVAVVGFGALLGACYTLEPAGGVVPEVGAELAFDVNDAGRVALGGTMGPEIGQIEGRLISRESGDFLVAVSAVHLLRGGMQVWGGEQVRLRPEYLGSTYQRHFSRERTLAMTAAGIGGFVYLVTRSLRGSGSPHGPLPPTDPAPASKRAR
jgi:hypothetical protein